MAQPETFSCSKLQQVAAESRIDNSADLVVHLPHLLLLLLLLLLLRRSLCVQHLPR
jgi:hypothetical protein